MCICIYVCIYIIHMHYTYIHIYVMYIYICIYREICSIIYFRVCVCVCVPARMYKELAHMVRRISPRMHGLPAGEQMV